MATFADTKIRFRVGSSATRRNLSPIPGQYVSIDRQLCSGSPNSRPKATRSAARRRSRRGDCALRPPARDRPDERRSRRAFLPPLTPGVAAGEPPSMTAGRGGAVTGSALVVARLSRGNAGRPGEAPRQSSDRKRGSVGHRGVASVVGTAARRSPSGAPTSAVGRAVVRSGFRVALRRIRWRGRCSGRLDGDPTPPSETTFPPHARTGRGGVSNLRPRCGGRARPLGRGGWSLSPRYRPTSPSPIRLRCLGAARRHSG